MQIYFFTLLIVTGAALLSQRRSHARHRTFFYLVAFSSMVLVAGLRASSVGTDTLTYTWNYTWNYARVFERQRLFFEGWQDFTNEPGYAFLSAIAQVVSDQYWALLTTIAVVVIFCHMRSIYKFSVNPAISIFVFITMGYYTFFFNGARQGIACAIYSLSFGALIDGNFRKYALWVFIAFLFHKTVIIALPLYFLFRQKYSLRFVLLMISIATVTILFFDSFLNFTILISDKYSVYKTLENRGGQLLTLSYLLISIFFIYFRSAIPIDDRRVYDCFMNMLILGTTIYLVVTFSGGYVEITRIAFYFQIALIFLWPIVFKNIRRFSIKHVLVSSFIFGHFIYFYIFTNKMAKLVPYKFNSVIYNWL